jgi:DNA-directed RNA polymerase specialized sigma24 family protein
MAAFQSSIALSSQASSKSATWCYLLLDNLQEFATLAWYLVADGKLVEEVFARVMTELDARSCNDSNHHSAYAQAREMIITHAIEVLANTKKDEEQTSFFQSDSASDLPNLPRLAFMLRFVIRSSEKEVAKYLDVSLTKVRELVRDEIDYLSISGPFSALTSCHDVEVS